VLCEHIAVLGERPKDPRNNISPSAKTKGVCPESDILLCDTGHARAKLALLPLDELHARLRALYHKRFRKQVQHIPVRVEAAELQLKVTRNVEDRS
jgi:hypothetical protein